MSSPYDDSVDSQTPLCQKLVKTICVSDVLQTVSHSAATQDHNSIHNICIGGECPVKMHIVKCNTSVYN